MSDGTMVAVNKKDQDLTPDLYHYSKITVLQEARVFNETPVNSRKCRILLAQIVYLIYTGETFSKQEATTLFFGVTRLFQNKDPALRQAVYLTLKELASTAEDVIMATSSIMKDMQPNSEVIYRPNAIRALYPIIDPAMLHGVERYFKAAIVDKNPSVASAALVTAYHLYPQAKDVIKRWVPEIQDALTNKSSSSSFLGSSGSGSPFSLGFGSSQPASANQPPPTNSYIVQYHALSLLYAIRQNERVAVMKMTQQYNPANKSGSTLKNPLAICLVIENAITLMEEDPNMFKPMLELVEGYLRHKSDIVNYEAARSICKLKNVTHEQLVKPISVLQLLMASPKPVTKFAAIRTLADLAQTHPASVATCNSDMEKLITDSNRSIATYAITTLLKTGNESSVDRLMKQITGFMSEIKDDFKVIVVDAVKTLCLKYPAKHATMLTFLASAFRDEGGYEFKNSIVQTISDMMANIPDCKEQALSHLCEFIEDCEFTQVSTRILYMIGIEGPKSPKPSRFIRFIYNRVVLENADVRAAAVSCLAEFGLKVQDESVKRSVRVLLERCTDDSDDEVRDRALMFVAEMDYPELEEALRIDQIYSLKIMMERLEQYINDPTAHDKPFDPSDIPKMPRDEAMREFLGEELVAPPEVKTGTTSSFPTRPTNVAESSSAYAQQLSEIPEFESYGRPLSSSTKPTELTETDTEYQVFCVKHIFKEHVVFQFNVSNTLQDTILEQVSIIMEPQTAGGVVEDFIIPIQSLTQAASPGVLYVSFTRQEPDKYALESFRCTLQFISKEVDPTTGVPESDGYQDEYQLEDVELAAGDYITPAYSAFGSEWDRLSSAATATEIFVLSAMESIQAACTSLVEILNMEPLGGTEHPASNSVHTLQLSGNLGGGGGKILVRCRMTFSSGQGVTLELAVRAEQESGCSLVFAAVGG